MNLETDRRLRHIVNRAILRTGDDPEQFTEAIIAETVLECIRQMSMPLLVYDPVTDAILSTIRSHLLRRFGISNVVAVSY